MILKSIKFIEPPTDELGLNRETMDALLGGIWCGVFEGKHCEAYTNGSSCDSPTTVRCEKYTW